MNKAVNELHVYFNKNYNVVFLYLNYTLYISKMRVISDIFNIFREFFYHGFFSKYVSTKHNKFN